MMRWKLIRRSTGIFIGVVLVLLGFSIQAGNVWGAGGDLLWEKQFDKSGGDDYGQAIAVGSNTVFVTGRGRNASGNDDIVTLAYNASTGNLLWEAQFDKAGGNDFGYAIAVGSNNVFVTGRGRNSSGNDDIVTLAYNAKTGNLLWEAQFDKAGGNDFGYAIAVGSNTVFVTGWGRNSSGNDDIVTLAYNSKTGDLLWEAQFDKAGGEDIGRSIAVKSNTVFVTGRGRNSSGNNDIVTLAYNSRTGDLLWEAQFDKAGSGDGGMAIAVGSNTVFVTGVVTNISGNWDIITLAYNARTGNKLWEKQFDNAGRDDCGNAIAVKGNTVFVTGYGINSSGNGDIVILAYDTRTGNQLWEKQLDKSGWYDYGRAIAVGSNTVFVTGWGGGDTITLAYDAKTGNLLWEKQFDGEDGNAIAVMGNTVFVTGFGVDALGNVDIITLAYDIN